MANPADDVALAGRLLEEAVPSKPKRSRRAHKLVLVLAGSALALLLVESRAGYAQAASLVGLALNLHFSRPRARASQSVRTPAPARHVWRGQIAGNAAEFAREAAAAAAASDDGIRAASAAGDAEEELSADRAAAAAASAALDLEKLRVALRLLPKLNGQEPPDRERRRALHGIATAAIGWLLGPLAEPARAASTPSACDQAIIHLADKATGRQLFLIGTAHISDVSAKLVANTIQKVKPDLVMVELDKERIGLARPANGQAVELWVKGGLQKGRIGPKAAGAKTSKRGSPVEVVAEGPAPASAPAPKLVSKPASTSAAPVKPAKNTGGIGEDVNAAFLGNVIQQGYQQMDKLGFQSGDEFATAFREANQLGVPVLLGDQDVFVTLDHMSTALKKTPITELLIADQDFEGMSDMVSALPSDWNDKGQISTAVEKLKQRETVRELSKILKKQAPLFYEAIVGERDTYMTRSLQLAVQPKETVVGVVGIVHADGIERQLNEAGWQTVSCSIA